jgi:hypothetical protein
LNELNSNTPGLEHWLTFRYQDNTTALFDFFVLFFAILHQRSQRKSRFQKNENHESTNNLAKFRRSQKRMSNLDQDQEKAKKNKELIARQFKEDDFTVNTSGCRDWSLMLVHEITVPLLFALFLLIGLLFPQYGLIGLGYVVLGAKGLIKYSPDPSVSEYTIENMRAVRLYNWFVLFLTVAYQFPMIPITKSFIQEVLPGSNHSVTYNNTCDYTYVNTNCMYDFFDGFAQISGLPKMK